MNAVDDPDKFQRAPGLESRSRQTSDIYHRTRWFCQFWTSNLFKIHVSLAARSQEQKRENAQDISIQFWGTCPIFLRNGHRKLGNSPSKLGLMCFKLKPSFTGAFQSGPNIFHFAFIELTHLRNKPTELPFPAWQKPVRKSLATSSWSWASPHPAIRTLVWWKHRQNWQLHKNKSEKNAELATLDFTPTHKRHIERDSESGFGWGLTGLDWRNVGCKI